MSTPDTEVERYCETVAQRLDGFERTTATVDGQPAVVFHDRSLQLSKFGVVDTVVVVGTATTPAEAAAFSGAAFDHGLAVKSILPRGLGGNLVVYPVIVSEADLHEWVDGYSRKHWSSFEFPVVVDPAEATVHYNESTPIWGSLYYRGFRTWVDRHLTP